MRIFAELVWITHTSVRLVFVMNAIMNHVQQEKSNRYLRARGVVLVPELL